MSFLCYRAVNGIIHIASRNHTQVELPRLGGHLILGRPWRKEASLGRPAKYPAGVRREAIALVKSSVRPVAEVARSLEIAGGTLWNWVTADREASEASIGSEHVVRVRRGGERGHRGQAMVGAQRPVKYWRRGTNTGTWPSLSPGSVRWSSGLPSWSAAGLPDLLPAAWDGPESVTTRRVAADRPGGLLSDGVGPPVTDFPSVRVGQHAGRMPPVDGCDGDSQRSDQVPVLEGHLVVACKENPRARDTVAEPFEHDVVEESVQVRRYQAPRRPSSMRKLGSESRADVCVDDDEARIRHSRWLTPT